MDRAVHDLYEMHVSTYSLKEAEGQQGTVRSPPGASVLIISLLQQELMAFVTFLIIGNPSVAAPQEQKKREVSRGKTTAHTIFSNK